MMRNGFRTNRETDTHASAYGRYILTRKAHISSATSKTEMQGIYCARSLVHREQNYMRLENRLQPTVSNVSALLARHFGRFSNPGPHIRPTDDTQVRDEIFDDGGVVNYGSDVVIGGDGRANEVQGPGRRTGDGPSHGGNCTRMYDERKFGVLKEWQQK